MTVPEYTGWLNNIKKILDSTVVANHQGESLALNEGWEYLCEKTLEVKRRCRNIYFIGNGASAAMASHFAVDFSKNIGIKAVTFFDISLVTAISNDMCYEEVFAYPLRTFSQPGDMLVGISSSGNSPNIIKAAQAAVEKKLFILSFTGFKPDNILRGMSDLSFYCPGDTYGSVESAHAILLHYWTDMMAGCLNSE